MASHGVEILVVHSGTAIIAGRDNGRFHAILTRHGQSTVVIPPFPGLANSYVDFITAKSGLVSPQNLRPNRYISKGCATSALHWYSGVVR